MAPLAKAPHGGERTFFVANTTKDTIKVQGSIDGKAVFTEELPAFTKEKSTDSIKKITVGNFQTITLEVVGTKVKQEISHLKDDAAISYHFTFLGNNFAVSEK